MAAGAVQIKVVAEGGIVEIYGVKVDNGKSHSVSSAPNEETSIIYADDRARKGTPL